MEMRKISVQLITVSMVLAIAIAGCGGGGGTKTGTGYTPGQSSTCTVGAVSFDINYVPSAANFPTLTDNSGTGSVSQAFWMAETEVTYRLWTTVYHWATHADRGVNIYYFQNAGLKGSDGAAAKSDLHPVTLISWRDAIVWCNALTEYFNAQNGTNLACVYTFSGTGAILRDSRDANATFCDNVIINSSAKGFRLPTSMEWELAARYKGTDSTNGAISRGGLYWTPGSYASAATADFMNATATGEVAWYGANSGNSTHVVGTVGITGHPNALGLYDMSGNVYEWCFDKPANELHRLIRGGSFGDDAFLIQVSYSDSDQPNFYFENLGFRPVRTE